jgi:hypothetical protein
MVAPVIANPQGEAIQCTRMDCFTPQIRNDEGCYSYCLGEVRSKAIQCTRMDCFTAFG